MPSNAFILSFLRGKGDYHRLGHGSDDHVRRPRKVAALQGKKIISIATGSLHCVACSDQGIQSEMLTEQSSLFLFGKGQMNLVTAIHSRSSTF